ncbi:hypothetical protein RhiirA5_432404 [Rhizophagus irregularis]|uniref:Uncharacterized protein n=1 Tax=Rhizophagus irregularis TaxID=588596 RepID=A0A2N0NTF0_9GLOM|nr:hypothetical protein RhiirA5_432404 [Rhizophagus irregularis]
MGIGRVGGVYLASDQPKVARWGMSPIVVLLPEELSTRISWAKAYMPFQFNGGIQSTQSIKSFNGIIKRSLNRTSTLCEMEEAINKRHEEEIRYCQLTDLKAKYTTVGLSHLLNFFQMLIQLLLNF